jgi:16S rRNA C967 or C1407 C5-methylase (RsmB/RsmF family)
LCTALALSWQGDDAPYPVHTLVNQAVEAARQQRQTQAQSGFINGCLRRFMREREALVAETDSDPQARWNHPRWWIERLQREVVAILGAPGAREQLVELGFNAIGNTPAQLTQQIQSEIERWRRVIQTARIEA